MDNNMIEIYFICSIVFGILAVLFGLLAIRMFRKYKIVKIIEDLTGRTRKKQLKKLEENSVILHPRICKGTPEYESMNKLIEFYFNELNKKELEALRNSMPPLPLTEVMDKPEKLPSEKKQPPQGPPIANVIFPQSQKKQFKISKKVVLVHTKEKIE